MTRSIVTTLGQPQIYILIIKEEITGSFLHNLEGLKSGTNYLRT